MVVDHRSRPFAWLVGIAAFVALSLGGLIAAVFVPSTAFAAPPSAVLALDQLGHAVQLNGAVTGETDRQPFLAFGSRALTHSHFSAGGFALDDALDRS